MRDGLIRFATLTGAVAQAALWLAGTGLVLMTAFVFAQVFYPAPMRPTHSAATC